MHIVFDILLPIFGVLGLGYAAARMGLFDEAANRGLSLFVFNFAMPLLLFRSIAQADLPDSMPWGFLLSYYLGAFAVFAAAMLLGRLLFARRLHEQGVLGLGASFSNNGMLGIPLIVTAYGPSGALPLFVLMSCHSLLLLPTSTAVIEAGRGGRQSVGRILLNLVHSVATTPLIWGLVAGLVFGLSGFTIPDSVDSIAKSLGNASTPCALFSLGASLTRYQISGNLREPLLIVVLKTLAHPCIVWLLATQVFAVDALWTVVAVTVAALPAGVTPYLFAQRYQACVSSSATAIFLSTMLSVVTLSGLLVVFRSS